MGQDETPKESELWHPPVKKDSDTDSGTRYRRGLSIISDVCASLYELANGDQDSTFYDLAKSLNKGINDLEHNPLENLQCETCKTSLGSHDDVFSYKSLHYCESCYEILET